MEEFELTAKEIFDCVADCDCEQGCKKCNTAIAKEAQKKLAGWLQKRTYGFDEGNGVMTYKTVYEEGEYERLLKAVEK